MTDPSAATLLARAQQSFDAWDAAQRVPARAQENLFTCVQTALLAVAAALAESGAAPSGSVSVTNFPATQPISGTVTANVGTVSVGNFPATQPVSGTVAVSNLPATQTVAGSVSVSNLPATQAVTGTVTANVGTGTQPVSGTVTANAGTGPWPVTDNGGSLTVDGAVTATISGTPTVNVASAPTTTVTGTVTMANPTSPDPSPATLAVTGTAAAGAAVSVTLPAVAGQFHYITGLQILKYNSAAVTGTAVPVVVTTTNLPGALAFTFPRAGAIGAVGVGDEQRFEFAVPLKSSAANTATTIVCPATTSVLWRVNVFYRAAA